MHAALGPLTVSTGPLLGVHKIEAVCECSHCLRETNAQSEVVLGKLIPNLLADAALNTRVVNTQVVAWQSRLFLGDITVAKQLEHWASTSPMTGDLVRDECWPEVFL